MTVSLPRDPSSSLSSSAPPRLYHSPKLFVTVTVCPTPSTNSGNEAGPAPPGLGSKPTSPFLGLSTWSSVTGISEACLPFLTTSRLRAASTSSIGSALPVGCASSGPCSGVVLTGSVNSSSIRLVFAGLYASARVSPPSNATTISSSPFTDRSASSGDPMMRFRSRTLISSASPVNGSTMKSRPDREAATRSAFADFRGFPSTAGPENCVRQACVQTTSTENGVAESSAAGTSRSACSVPRLSAITQRSRSAV